MHELAICRAIVRQVLAVAASNDMPAVGRIMLRIGPLAGVEPGLLCTAFPIVAAGTPCEGAMLEIENMAVQVVCRHCGSTSIVRPNRLLCGTCGNWQVALLSGDEMLLTSIECADSPFAKQKERADV
jgi:hydrogenase nickel incorporation protein HypA/HybF